MGRLMAASIAALLVATPWRSSCAREILVYRCVGADAAVRLQDRPCAPDETQQARILSAPRDAQPPASPSPTPVPDVVHASTTAVAVPAVIPEPLYECRRHDGSTYESETGVPERRWVPLWVLGIEPRDSLSTIRNVGRPASAPPRSGPGLSLPAAGAAIGYGAGTWVEDSCHRLPPAIACDRRRGTLRELDRKRRLAFPSEREPLDRQYRELREQLRVECGLR